MLQMQMYICLVQSPKRSSSYKYIFVPPSGERFDQRSRCQACIYASCGVISMCISMYMAIEKRILLSTCLFSMFESIAKPVRRWRLPLPLSFFITSVRTAELSFHPEDRWRANIVRPVARAFAARDYELFLLSVSFANT